MKAISKSKRQLAHLLIEAGVTQFPDDAHWAAQERNGEVWAYQNEPSKKIGDYHWSGEYTRRIARPASTLYGWYQAKLSRAEFDQIFAEAAPDADGWIECVDMTDIGKAFRFIRRP